MAATDQSIITVVIIGASFSALNSLLIGLLLYIVSDLRRRVHRIEDMHMNGDKKKSAA